MNKLFDKIPEEFFSPLSRKYKSIYAFALVSLYHMLREYKTDIRRSDYVAALKSNGEELLQLFSIEADKLDDKTDEEAVDMDVAVDVNDDSAVLSSKVSYIVRKLSKCGWFIVSRDPKSKVDYVYVPAYAIQFLKLIDELTSDVGSYLPLVHQTYAELQMEDEKEDDYMYRSLLNARMNADTLEMSVTLLRQQICVFGNKLTHVMDPNVALKQHFDEYRVDIAEKYYHPMKTFDSLGLYAQPTIAILKKWLKSERIVTMLVREAKTEPQNRGKKTAELTSDIIKLINDIVDIFSRLTEAFNEIDQANANYTESVQKKINYLSSTDKTVKGKIDRIIRAMAEEMQRNPALRYEELPTLEKATDTISLFRQGYLDSGSMGMPIRRGTQPEYDPLPLDDIPLGEEMSALVQNFYDNDINRFSDATIISFMEKNMAGKLVARTYEFTIENLDDLVLLILGTIKSMLGVIPYKAEKVSDRIDYAGYYMPCYEFTKKKGARK